MIMGCPAQIVTCSEKEEFDAWPNKPEVESEEANSDDEDKKPD